MLNPSVVAVYEMIYSKVISWTILNHQFDNGDTFTQTSSENLQE